MDSRERVRRALTFENPDRIPVSHSYLPAAMDRYGHQLEELFQTYPEDVGNRFFPPTDAGHRLYRKGRFVDEWGSVWENYRDGVLGQVKGFPLDEWSDLKTFQPPFEYMGTGLDDADEVIRAHRDKFFTGHFCRLFERMHFLRPMEKVMVDLMVGSREIYQLRDMIHDFNMRDLRLWLKHDFDAITLSDDWGSQNQLLIPPKLWREFFKPCYQEMISLVRETGRLVLFHSDGYILEIIGDLIDLGVNAINAQVFSMDLDVLQKEFTGRICFWGGMDRQYILPRGTPDEVSLAAKAMIEKLSTPQGGFVGQGEIGPDVPLENAEAMLRAWTTYRRSSAPGVPP
jgi:uroporphyrinogen decarboxylase